VGCLTCDKPFDFGAAVDHDRGPEILSGIFTTLADISAAASVSGLLNGSASRRVWVA